MVPYVSILIELPWKVLPQLTPAHLFSPPYPHTLAFWSHYAKLFMAHRISHALAQLMLLSSQLPHPARPPFSSPALGRHLGFRRCSQDFPGDSGKGNGLLSVPLPAVCSLLSSLCSFLLCSWGFPRYSTSLIEDIQFVEAETWSSFILQMAATSCTFLLLTVLSL